MLKLLLSTDWVAGRDRILNMVARDVQQKKGGRILMVPELISHEMERRLCAVAGDTASRYAEVLSFTRMARRVADSVGHAARECLDNGGRVVAMASAARQLHSRLKAYASVETRPEFLTGLVDAVDEFKRCCIGAEDLKMAAAQTEGAFAQKLEELALLLEAYDGLCSRGKRDPRDQMTWLLEQLYDSDFAQTHTFYIDGFPDFTRQHLAILEYLIGASEDVVVSMNCDRPGTTGVAFETAANTVGLLIGCARRAGVEVQITHVQPEPVPLLPLHSLALQGDTAAVPQLRGRLLACRGDSVYHECTLAAQRVLDLVDAGCRYRQIGIVCADMGAYENAISLVFNRCGIPLYRSGTEEILQKTVVTTVLCAMGAALGGFERQDVLHYLKSMLSPLELSDCDLLENYAIIWNINGSRWLKSWQNHPDGLDGKWDEASRARLEQLDRLRQQAMQPLQELHRRFRMAERLADQVEALYAFFEQIGLAQRLSSLAQEMDLAGDNRSAQILNQLWEILLSALEQMHDVLGDTVWDTETFTRLFTLLLSQYDVGTIPPVLDAVTAGSVSAMRCQQVDHLILLGANEGSLPGYCGSTGILTDQERDALRQLGVPLTGGGMEGLQAEFSEIYGVLCGARETAMLTCSGTQPSFIYRRFCGLAGGETVLQPLLAGCDPLDAAAMLVSQGAQEVAVSLGLSEQWKRIRACCGHSLGSVSSDHIRGLYGSTLHLSASQIDRQAECRLSYFLKYGLRAKERKEATVDPAEFGTYVHAMLEQTARRVMELGGFHKVSLEQTIELAMEYSEAYTAQRFSQLDSQRMSYLFRRNVQELAMVVEELWQELSESSFTPVDFEVAFGNGAQMDAIGIAGSAMYAQLRGFVDRVDAWKQGQCNYFRVVDYKTGRKDFDYCDVFNGIGLQMLLYLFALESNGESLLGDLPIPVGVQYFPARSPVLSANGRLTEEQARAERGKQWKRKGLILADADVIGAMEPQEGPKRASCRIGKDGTVTGDVAQREQLQLLREYIFRVLRGLVDDIAAGNVQPNPYTRGTSHDACMYCPYQAVCHYATVPGRRNYKAMTAQRFWDEIGKEMSSNG